MKKNNKISISQSISDSESNFIDYYLRDGLGIRDAYIKSHPDPVYDDNPNLANSRALKFIRQPHIEKAIALHNDKHSRELDRHAANGFGLSVEGICNRLVKIIDDDSARDTDKIKSCEILLRCHGALTPNDNDDKKRGFTVKITTLDNGRHKFVGDELAIEGEL